MYTIVYVYTDSYVRHGIDLLEKYLVNPRLEAM